MFLLNFVLVSLMYSCCCVPFWVFCFIVLFCVLCTVLLPPGVNQIAVNKYIIAVKCSEETRKHSWHSDYASGWTGKESCLIHISNKKYFSRVSRWNVFKLYMASVIIYDT
jgi:hypothetical protein